MLIRQDFLDHWKTLDFVAALDEGCAPLYLIRLWSHCQSAKSGRFRCPKPVHLANICRWTGSDPAVFERAMIETGWAVREGEDIIAVGFEDNNAPLVAAWRNGHKGGRPAKTGGGKKTHGLTQRNPAVNQGGNPSQTHGLTNKQINKQIDKQTKSKTGGAEKQSPESVQAFEAWWSMYPKRPGRSSKGNKGAARIAWALLDPSEWDRVTEATRRLIESDTLPKDAERFIRPPRGGGDPPYIAELDETDGPQIGGDSPRAAQSREKGHHGYDDSWIAGGG